MTLVPPVDGRHESAIHAGNLPRRRRVSADIVRA